MAVKARLDKVLMLQEQTLSVLRGVDENVRLIKEGPFHSGVLFLREAAEPRRRLKDRRDFIVKARDKFIDALAMEQDVLRAAVIQTHIATCWLMLGEKKDAYKWLFKAYKTVEKGLYKTALEIDEENLGDVRLIKKIFRSARNKAFEERIAPMISFINSLGAKLKSLRIKPDDGMKRKFESLGLESSEFPRYMLRTWKHGEDNGLMYIFADCSPLIRRFREKDLRLLLS
ncbi:MAG TPA: hypothetical protein VF591_27695 [Pyrinomonadaceae bacterium]|jgi:hypothetical protein